MAVDFYSTLAGAKTQGESDGDFILPDQQGSIVVHKFILKQKQLKTTVIFVGQILESNATKAGALVQMPQAMVKNLYLLSKYDWAIDHLKTDMVNMLGVDEKEMSPAKLAELFKDVFEDGQMKGAVVNFRSYEITRPGKPTLTKVLFSEAVGDVNSEKAIAARAATIE